MILDTCEDIIYRKSTFYVTDNRESVTNVTRATSSNKLDALDYCESLTKRHEGEGIFIWINPPDGSKRLFIRRTLRYIIL